MVPQILVSVQNLNQMKNSDNSKKNSFSVLRRSGMGGNTTRETLRPDLRPARTQEDYQRLENLLSTGSISSFQATNLVFHYKKTAQLQKLEALYVSHGHLLARSRHKSAVLLEKKYTETGTLNESELIELRLAAYEYARKFHLGRWFDTETPEQLFAIIHAMRWYYHHSKFGHKADVAPLQSALDKVAQYDPSCGLLLFFKFLSAVRGEQDLRVARHYSESNQSKQRVKTMYAEIITLGEQNSLWKHLRVDAKRSGSYPLRGPSRVATASTRAEDDRLEAAENQRYEAAVANKRHLDKVAFEIAAEIGNPPEATSTYGDNDIY